MKSFRQQLLVTTAIAGVTVLSNTGVNPSLAQEATNSNTELSKITVHGNVNVAEKATETDTVISTEELERQNSSDLRNVFSQTPSVAVTSGSTATQKLFVRGVDQSKLNVQIDGVRQKNGVWHHNGNIGIDPYFLKQVEVDAGIAPADHGPGALGGAVRLETKNARDFLVEGQTSGVTLRTSYESNSDTIRFNKAAYQVHEGFESLSLLSRSRGEDYVTGSGQKERGTAENIWNGLLKLAYQNQEGHRFEFSGEYYRDHGNRRLRPNLNFLRVPLFNDNTAERITSTFKYTTTNPTDMYDPEVIVYFNRNKLDRPKVQRSRRPTGDFVAVNDEIGGKFQNRINLANGTLTAGFDFYSNDTHIQRFYTTPNVSERVRNVGAFAQLRFSPFERLDVSTGVRVDRQSYHAVDNQTFDNIGFSPNISAEYEILDGLKIGAGYAYVFGGLEQAETALFHVNQRYLYDPNIKPTNSHNIEASITYEKDGLSLGATVFNTRIENGFMYDRTNWPRFATRTNATDDLETHGFELRARYSDANSYIGAAFTRTDVKFGNRIALPNDSNTANTIGDVLALEVGHTFEEYNLSVGANAEITFDYDDPALTNANFLPLEGYQVVNLFAEWSPKQFENINIRADIHNVLDQKYVARGNWYHSTNFGGLEPIYSPGRSYNLTVTTKF